ncbi:hypothetical protein ACH5RR_033360 [Cinchona calisaya]|uniref:Peptidase A1 domain-containing protein n=1 Tax=Cinchona calisaya TaxID=153742 RepID=A0ABD2YR14_9GENT
MASLAVFLGRILSLFMFTCACIAETSFRPKALLLPVIKDSSTNQYVTQISQRTPLVPIKLTLDLGGESLWVDCDKDYISSTYKPVHCRSSLCSLVKTPVGCGGQCFSSPKPGCNNNSCSVFPENSVSGVSTIGELAKDVVSIHSTDGSNLGPVVSFPRLVFTCGATFLLEKLANGVKGMAGFGRSPIGLPSQLSHAFRFPRKFAICLSSSTTSNGVIFLGDGPYVMLPNVDISQSLTYTPLIVNPVSVPGTTVKGQNPSFEYYIGVKGIKVNTKVVPVNTTLFKINKLGFGGTRISTTVPYTVLESSIYNAVTNAFISSISKVPRVKAVAPFKACYSAKSLGSTRLGPGVPSIEFVLQNKRSVSWMFFGANSMVPVKDDVFCLGFVDGGLDTKEASITIGGYQLENALLQFDLARSRLGFMSTILGRQTTCANFNFTSKA